MGAVEGPEHLLLAKIKANSKVKAWIEASIAENLVRREPFYKEATFGEKIIEWIER